MQFNLIQLIIVSLYILIDDVVLGAVDCSFATPIYRVANSIMVISYEYDGSI